MAVPDLLLKQAAYLYLEVYLQTIYSLVIAAWTTGENGCQL
jgi:hypothetical protein